MEGHGCGIGICELKRFFFWSLARSLVFLIEDMKLSNADMSCERRKIGCSTGKTTVKRNLPTYRK